MRRPYAAAHMRAVVLGAAVATLLGAAAGHAGGPLLTGVAKDFPAAQALAAAEGRPVLLEFSAEWCGPCQKFARESKTSPIIQKGLASVVFHPLDAEKAEGLELAKPFNVKNYPTFILTNAKGETIDRWLGYSSPERWEKSLSARGRGSDHGRGEGGALRRQAHSPGCGTARPDQCRRPRSCRGAQTL